MTHEELKAAGIELTAASHARLAAFVRALLVENERVNLTAAADELTVWRAHVCDGLALLATLHDTADTRLLDVGSGGGLPGLPLACACERVAVTLLDAVRKKVAALDRIITHIGLSNARAVWGRAEVLARDASHREQYDVVTSRAVAVLPVLLEYAAGFVRPGGCCWFFKAASAAEHEIGAAASAAEACALVHVETRAYRLPWDGTARLLVGYRKERPLDDRLPRPAGRAKKRPL